MESEQKNVDDDGVGEEEEEIDETVSLASSKR